MNNKYIDNKLKEFEKLDQGRGWIDTGYQNDSFQRNINEVKQFIKEALEVSYAEGWKDAERNVSKVIAMLKSEQDMSSNDSQLSSKEECKCHCWNCTFGNVGIESKAAHCLGTHCQKQEEQP